ncbi:MAG: plasmid stability protein [Rhodothermales bacterium]|jgi:plasmid stability protein
MPVLRTAVRSSQRLRQRASAAGVSLEEAHRQLLRAALLPDSELDDLHAYLLQMPDMGSDSDFVIPRPVSVPVDL